MLGIVGQDCPIRNKEQLANFSLLKNKGRNWKEILPRDTHCNISFWFMMRTAIFLFSFCSVLAISQGKFW